MKHRYVRTGDALDYGEEIVIRGGDLAPDVVRSDAQRMFDIYCVYGISVFALRGATLEELAQQTPLIRFSELALVTVRTIRAAGPKLEPTGRNPRHYTVDLPLEQPVHEG